MESMDSLDSKDSMASINAITSMDAPWTMDAPLIYHPQADEYVPTILVRIHTKTHICQSLPQLTVLGRVARYNKLAKRPT